jgi:hypothetical protein
MAGWRCVAHLHLRGAQAWCKCRGSARAVTPGQPLGFPGGSRRVVPRTPFRGVVIAVRAAWRPLSRRARVATPGSGPARRGAWPAARPARRSDWACRAEVGRPRRKWGKRRIRAGGGRAALRGCPTATGRTPQPRNPLRYSPNSTFKSVIKDDDVYLWLEKR